MPIRPNSLGYDISPELRRLLGHNGMQAYMDFNDKDELILHTKTAGGNEHQYKLTQEQEQALLNRGTNFFNKKAYETFVSIVKQDYDVPGSYVAAKNANSPVNMGQYGYRIMDGEYGHRRFHSWDDPRFGRFSEGPITRLTRAIFGIPSGNIRRIGGDPYLQPVVAERPDHHMKPGEIKSGSYGFYEKPQKPQKDALAGLDISAAPESNRPKGLATVLDRISYKNGKPYIAPITNQHWKDVLDTHGIEINREKKTLTIKADNVGYDLIYKLSDKQIKQLLDGNFEAKTRMVGGKRKTDPYLSIQGRLNLINNLPDIKRDFGAITRAQLNSKDMITIVPTKDLQHTLNERIKEDTQKQYKGDNRSMVDVVNIDNTRENFRTGFLNQWNTIGVVDGRTLDEKKGFYLPIEHGRAVSVGEIRAYETNEQGDRKYKMTAVINNEVFTHDISKEDYNKFLNYDDEHRLKLFDKVFDEVKIKSASNGAFVDAHLGKQSSTLERTTGVLDLGDNFKVRSQYGTANITSALAFKDRVSNSYVLEVADNKDTNVWTTRITEADFNKLKAANTENRAKLISTLLPTFVSSGVVVEAVSSLKKEERHEGFNDKKAPGNSYDDYKHDYSNETVVAKEARWQRGDKSDFNMNDKEGIVATPDGKKGKGNLDKQTVITDEEQKKTVGSASSKMNNSFESVLSDLSKKAIHPSDRAEVIKDLNNAIAFYEPAAEKGTLLPEELKEYNYAKAEKFLLSGDKDSEKELAFNSVKEVSAYRISNMNAEQKASLIDSLSKKFPEYKTEIEKYVNDPYKYKEAISTEHILMELVKERRENRLLVGNHVESALDALDPKQHIGEIPSPFPRAAGYEKEPSRSAAPSNPSNVLTEDELKKAGEKIDEESRKREAANASLAEKTRASEEAKRVAEERNRISAIEKEKQQFEKPKEEVKTIRETVKVERPSEVDPNKRIVEEKVVEHKEVVKEKQGKEDKTDLAALRAGVRLALTGDALVNGGALGIDKPNKEWVRGGGHGRATTVGDIAVQQMKDAQGQPIIGKYKMSAVIDGNVISHEITQKDFDKFRAFNDTQRMKLFDKIFPEVKMQTKPGQGLNLGAAILAAVSTVADVAIGISAMSHQRPEIYSRGVFTSEAAPNPAENAAAAYARESERLRPQIGPDLGLGR